MEKYIGTCRLLLCCTNPCQSTRRQSRSERGWHASSTLLQAGIMLPQRAAAAVRVFNSFSHMGSHRSEPIGKLCRSAFSLILARSFWTGRDVSSAEVHGLHEPLARLPSPFEMPVARKEEPHDADKALTTSLIHLLPTSRKSAVTSSMRSEGRCELAEASGTLGRDS